MFLYDKRLLKRFREFGGWRLVITYFRIGVMWPAVKSVCKNLVRHQPIKNAYPSVIASVGQRLAEEYKTVLDKDIESYNAEGQARYAYCDNVPKILWTCWLQGVDQAPSLVKKCVESQKKQFPDYEHRLLTLDNYKEWVTLPQYIVDKYNHGRIPNALFSDLIRLAGLKKYGGVWMDTTVFCSGFGNDKLKQRWQRIEKSELTLFRFYNRGSKQPVGLSNWFIAAKPHHVVIGAVLDMLLAYWKDYNCTVDYFIMHLFLNMTFKKVPQVWDEMPRENSNHSLVLASVMDKPYNDAWWDDVKAHVYLHKLNYRKEGDASKVHNSFYNHIFS